MESQESRAPVAVVYAGEDDPLLAAFAQLGWRVHPMGSDVDTLLAIKADLWAVVLVAEGSEPALFLQALARLRPEVPLLLVATPAELERNAEQLTVAREMWPAGVDVVVAPYGPEELALRVAWLRRERPAALSSGKLPADMRIHEVGNLRVDIDRHAVTFDSREVALTRSEFLILQALMRADGRVVTKDTLNSLIHGETTQRGDGPLEAHVSRLRHKLAAAGLATAAIRSVRGVGYTLDRVKLGSTEA